MSEKRTLTTTAGAPVGDNQNSQTAGARGPVLMQDYQLLEKLAHQNRERIAERTVHAKGWGAYGTLTIEHDISMYTKAKALHPGTKTRDVRTILDGCRRGWGGRCRARRAGFRTEVLHRRRQLGPGGQQYAGLLYSRPIQVSRLHPHTEKASRTNLRSPTAMWDFWSLSPESLHQITILFSDRGLPEASVTSTVTAAIRSASSTPKTSGFG